MPTEGLELSDSLENKCSAAYIYLSYEVLLPLLSETGAPYFCLDAYLAALINVFFSELFGLSDSIIENSSFILSL